MNNNPADRIAVWRESHAQLGPLIRWHDV